MPYIASRNGARSIVFRYMRMQANGTSTRNRLACINYFYQLWTAWPVWADKCPKIKEIYKRAKEQGLTVDHIVPLRNPIVCGLHVYANLQLLTREENQYKGNHWWPDHPFENLDLFD